MYSAGSPGPSTSRHEALLIFDLDGTILSVNSFPYWARYMLAGRFGGLSRRERLALSLRTGRVLMERKLLRQSHSRAKRRLQEIWRESLARDASQAALTGFNTILHGLVRPNMRPLMAEVAQQRFDAVLATAAAAEYAQNLAVTLGFRHALATHLSDRSDNAGERKRDRVLSMLAEQGWHNRRRIFLTDHEEDLPLIRECEHILWFGRDEDAAGIQARAPGAKVIACRNASDAELLRLAGGG